MRIWQTPHNEELDLYHIQQIQNLGPGDMSRQIEFCCWFDEHPHLHHSILFTDEMQFACDRINKT
jgi:hypothetical protein